jgi:ABC-type glycerol-3-phosphate transport system permease component
MAGRGKGAGIVTTRQAVWRRRTYRLSLMLLLIALCMAFLLPVYGMLVTSFKTVLDILRNGFWGLPKQWTVSPFYEAWKMAELGKTFANTFIIAIPAVMGSIFISALGAYALARIRFAWSFPIFIFLISGLFFPPQIVLYPLFRLFTWLGLYDTHLAQIITNIAYGIPICTLILRNFFRTIPFELQDAASIDGCSHLRIFLRIILPLSKPALAALVIFQFTWIWNNFLWGLVLSDHVATPIMVGLMLLKGQYLIQWNAQAAGTMLASLPVVIVFLAFQKYFIRGLLMGSNK